MTDTAQRLTAYCRESGRVCPRPPKWNALWEMLLQLRDDNADDGLSAPLILGGWHYSSNLEKMIRLGEHIEWADRHGALSEVDAYLRALHEQDWHHLTD